MYKPTDNNIFFKSIRRTAPLGLVGYIMAGAIANAQVTVFEGLPPLPSTPPTIPSLRDTPESPPIQVPNQPTQEFEEFNFEAPRSPATPSFSSPTGRYRVEVKSTDRLMLSSVRQIEPGAFIKGDRIQAGLFSNKDNAKTLRDRLEDQGIDADVVKVNPSDSNAFSTTAIGSSTAGEGYFVAIPNRDRSSVNIQSQLLQAGISPGLIQERSEPRGEHIAIGPFANRQEATSISTQIRALSLDGRVYFDD